MINDITLYSKQGAYIFRCCGDNENILVGGGNVHGKCNNVNLMQPREVGVELFWILILFQTSNKEKIKQNILTTSK